MERIAAFLEHAWQNKLWIVGLSILAAATTYLGSFVPRIPAEWERFHRRAVEMDENLEEGSRVSRVYEAVGEITKAHIRATERYSKDFGGKSSASSIDSHDLRDGITLMGSSLNTARTSLGTLQGIRLRDKDLEMNRGVIDENAKAVVGYVEILSGFYLAHAANNSDGITRLSDSIRGAVSDQARVGAALYQAAGSFSASALALSRKQNLAAARSIAELRIFYAKGYLALLAVFYVLIFAGVVVRRIVRPRQGRQIVLP